MSEFRLFCIVCFATMGIVAAGANHGFWPRPNDGAAGLIGLGLMLGCAAVALFGKRVSA